MSGNKCAAFKKTSCGSETWHQSYPIHRIFRWRHALWMPHDQNHHAWRVCRRFVVFFERTKIPFIPTQETCRLPAWNLKITELKRNIICQTSILVFHVNSPGCIGMLFILPRGLCSPGCVENKWWTDKLGDTCKGVEGYISGVLELWVLGRGSNPWLTVGSWC